MLPIPILQYVLNATLIVLLVMETLVRIAKAVQQIILSCYLLLGLVLVYMVIMLLVPILLDVLNATMIALLVMEVLVRIAKGVKQIIQNYSLLLELVCVQMGIMQTVPILQYVLNATMIVLLVTEVPIQIAKVVQQIILNCYLLLGLVLVKMGGILVVSILQYVLNATMIVLLVMEVLVRIVKVVQLIILSCYLLLDLVLV